MYEAGEIITDVDALRARSFDALPCLFASCLSNPDDHFADEFGSVLLAHHAQKMFEVNVRSLDKVLAGQPLDREDIDALTWLRAAAESFTTVIEKLRNEDQLWLPDEVKRAAMPFDGEVPF